MQETTTNGKRGARGLGRGWLKSLDGPAVISLFTGGGGLDLGLEQAGFEIKVCIESDQERCRTLKQNRPDWKVLQKDINEVRTKEILNNAGLRAGEAALVSAGPPCQPFSKSAFWARSEQNSMSMDMRVKMLGQCTRVIKEAKPRAFIVENVPGLTYKTALPHLLAMVKDLNKAGYSCFNRILNAADYGVPQTRQRLFLIGASGNTGLTFPEPSAGKNSYVTAGDAIGDLDDGIVLDDEKVGGKWGHLLPLIPPGSNYLHLAKQQEDKEPIFRWRSRYWSFLLKLSPSRPSWTIQASPGPYTGPFHWSNRRLRVRELRRLQQFPEDWLFCGDEKSVVAQIGDAVPPPLARTIGQALMLQLFKPADNVKACRRR